MRKQIRAQEEKNVKSAEPAAPSTTPLPAYLLDRSNPANAKALSSAIKNKRAEKAAKFSVPLPKVKGISEEEMFKVVKTGKKTAKKSWKRMITQPTFVGPDFTRRPVKYERFIRPMGLRHKKCNVTHPEVSLLFPCILIRAWLLTRIPAWRYGPAPHHQCQEEPAIPVEHAIGCTQQGYGHRGQCIRNGSRHGRWKGRVGSVRSDHEQSCKRGLCQRRLACLRVREDDTLEFTTIDSMHSDGVRLLLKQLNDSGLGSASMRYVANFSLVIDDFTRHLRGGLLRTRISSSVRPAIKSAQCSIKLAIYNYV